VAVDIWHPRLQLPFTLVLADARVGRDELPRLFLSLPGAGEASILLEPELTGDEDDADLSPEEPEVPEGPFPEPAHLPDEIEVWPVPIRPRRRRWRFLLLYVTELSAEPLQIDGGRFINRAIEEMVDAPPGVGPVRVNLMPWMLSDWGGDAQ
jgi:hypothetical protein